MISPSLLRKVMPTLPAAKAEIWAPLLTAAAGEFGITPPGHVAMWLAQAAHESAELSRLVESLSYSAERMIVVWPTRFGHGKRKLGESEADVARRKETGRKLAASLARKPEALAEHVYGGRMGNGPSGSGDGWRYRGRCIFMLTGLDNYRRAEEETGIPLVDHPDLAAEPEAAARLAGWYWRDRRLDRYAEADDLRGATKAIQGAYLGLAEREAYWKRARLALGLPARAAA